MSKNLDSIPPPWVSVPYLLEFTSGMLLNFCWNLLRMLPASVLRHSPP